MPEIKGSTLPAVLKEYMPGYEPQITSRKQVEQDKSLKPERKQSKAQPDSDGNKDKIAENVDEVTKSIKKPKRDKTQQGGPSREASFLDVEPWQAHERSYEHWQEAKEERREREQQRLDKKLRLQSQLIQAQDDLFEKKRLHAEQQEKKKRQLDKETKQSKEEELLKICRESMERDRKRREDRIARQKKQQESKAGSIVGSDTGTDTSHGSDLSHQQHRHRKLSVFNRDTSTGQHLTKMTTEEEKDENLEPDELSDEQLTEIPWHHAQLHKLYGSSVAETFIHPKIEQKPKKPVPQKLKRQGGRAGAETLWSILRKDSLKKLLRQDRNIPEELKNAYGSFVRQRLTKKKTPVKRNFYASEDVPEMDRLLDNSVLFNVADYRHKIGMMHRASTSNEDRGKVLMHNNPPPDFNNLEGLEGIGRYLPSWMDEDWDKESAPDYMRWLNKKQEQKQLELTDHQENAEYDDLPSEAPQPLADIPEENESRYTPDDLADSIKGSLEIYGGNKARNQHVKEEDWDFMLVQKKQKAKTKKPGVQFLTEKEATVPGQFSLRYNEAREMQNVPKAVTPSRLKGSKSAMAMIGGSGSGVSSRHASGLDSLLSDTGSRKGASYSAPATSRQEFYKRYTDSWEPLSMRALVEYKDHRGAIGEGDYGYGKAHLWSQKSPAIDV